MNNLDSSVATRYLQIGLDTNSLTAAYNFSVLSLIIPKIYLQGQPQFMIPYISLSVLEIATACIALVLLLVSSSTILHCGVIEYAFTFSYKINQTTVRNITLTNDGDISYMIETEGDHPQFVAIIGTTTIVVILAVIVTIYIGWFSIFCFVLKE